MNRTSIFLVMLCAYCLMMFLYCQPETSKTKPSTQQQTPKTPPKPAQLVAVPGFQADSAYYFVKKQVEFGARVPGSNAHKKCAKWLAGELRRFGLEVIEQSFVAKTYFGNLDAVNIIGQYKPENPYRILLCAHWDSRHIADEDTKDKDKPILGADDGGSGVAVLLEIARLLQQTPIDLGVDFILFDAEDLGDNRFKNEPNPSVKLPSAEATEKTWCLGSQHWASQPHKPGYSAMFGILLDMVGAKGAVFPREGYSTVNALSVQDKIYNLASNMGYGELFPNRNGAAITDDHVFIMRKLAIPVVNIIGMPGEAQQGSFGRHWHTHNDNLNVIDRSVLKAVGQVTTAMVYRTYNQNI